ncbi:MAG: hypothetical protein WB440_09900 [Steroidobacteraceae bacterium]|jgi:hypothetical protein
MNPQAQWHSTLAAHAPLWIPRQSLGANAGQPAARIMGYALTLQMRKAAAARAAANVAAWKTYLPEDCVASMVNDGWHRST